MRIEYARRIYGATPQSPLGRLLGLVAIFFIVVAAVVVLAIGAVVAGMGMLLAPVIGWWRSRQLESRGGVSIERPHGEPGLADEPPPKVIDAEFTPIEKDP
jgi:hypothetical protein